jgi:hypothetical protein
MAPVGSGAIMLAMIRTSPSNRVLLLAERPRPEASGVPMRRFRIARLGFHQGRPARSSELAPVPASDA